MDDDKVEQKSPHVAIDIDKLPENGELPPAFTPYEAEFYESDQGDILSHDHHLNEDGEALNQFILSHAQKYPNYQVSIHGHHTERRYRTVYRNGRTIQESYTVTIVDFTFSIDLNDYIIAGPLHFARREDEACYRGLMVRQIQSPNGRSKATKEQISEFKTDKYTRLAQGIPPWFSLDGTQRDTTDKGLNRTIRDWADEYGSSPKILKEFVYEKSVYGWSEEKLKEAIQQLIRSTGYTDTVSIRFETTANKICIRPDNGLSRTLSSLFYKVLLWIFLVYPFIWLFKRFSSRGGGRWEMVGGMYALCQKGPVQPGEDISHIPMDNGTPTIGTRLLQTDEGLVKVSGLREGEWFRRWEDRIRINVVQRRHASEPLRDTDLHSAVLPPLAVDLDGY